MPKKSGHTKKQLTPSLVTLAGKGKSGKKQPGSGKVKPDRPPAPITPRTPRTTNK